MPSLLRRVFPRALTVACAVAGVGVGAIALPVSASGVSTPTPRPAVSLAQITALRSLLSPPLPGVASIGTQLLLDGAPHTFTGINAYELGTWWQVNPGCGSQVDDLDGFFGSLPSHSLVRFWAFQSLAVNKYTHTWDFTALDRVFNAAVAHHDYLIATLSDQAGTCDGDFWHNDAWYKGGYQSIHESDGQGRNITSFAGWVNKVVPRYRNSAALGMWELVNEPEPSNCFSGFVGYNCQGHNTCPADATGSLRSFFDKMGAKLHSLDARHLVASGLIGRGQCGSADTAYSYVSASPGIDVMTYHDYGAESQPPLPDYLVTALAVAKANNKPLVTEEAGVWATATPQTGCAWSFSTRARQMAATSAAQRAAGVSAYLPWDWVPQASTQCSADIGPGDPVLAALLQP